MTSSIDPLLLKSLIAGAVVFVVDNKVLKDADMYGSAYIAAASSVGIYAGSKLGAKLVPNITPNPSEQNIIERVAEIGVGVTTAYALNRFILKNDAYGTTTKRIGAIVLADIVSTLAVEYLNGQPLMIL